MLQELHRLGFHDFAYGEWERGTWNFQPWREGPDLYQLWAPCREPDSRRRQTCRTRPGSCGEPRGTAGNGPAANQPGTPFRPRSARQRRPKHTSFPSRPAQGPDEDMCLTTRLGELLQVARDLELHSRGWAHGDVQPAHFIIGPERTHLIDLALARGGHVPEGNDFPFRGCLVHYEAPETEQRRLPSNTAVKA
ncbi:hypothetical protein GCM10020367_50890 [Streptomyces sannanensis]|uniref:Protein kinase domain-containing protein n=1 Tax=Streptomyces sannanensis TaxID=285536 RepID=A0ABP6SIG7_9ACTN